MKITEKMKTISKQYFIFNYSSFRYENKPCDRLIFFNSEYVCVQNSIS